MNGALTAVKDIDDLIGVVAEAKIIVTDSNVKSLYGGLLQSAYAFPAGEKSKTPETLFGILKAMHERGMKRGDTLCAVGGGVAGDVAGLAAALYMRGVKFVNVPTTLLAIVDSSIGGKTAVNFDGVKNLIGAFKDRSVYVCYEFLNTLPEREKICGAGEIIKTCLLTSDSYALLKKNTETLKAFCSGEEYDKAALSELINACMDIKSRVVKRDPYEKGLRKILNVGHTVGHALESVNNYGKSHGEYVLMGIMTELCMLREFADKEFFGEIIPVLKSFALPPKTTVNAVLKAADSDKKNGESGITVMLAARAGDIREIVLSKEEFIVRYNTAVKDLRS